jgi:hypothetical protein
VSTLLFPQLATGSVAQFPTRKHVVQRTVVNTSPGGSVAKMADPEAGGNVWELSYTGLTDAEVSAFEELFDECEGRLRDFLFLDPLGNLLKWTEDLTNSSWQTGMQVVGEQEDPLGGAGAARVTNAAQAPQSLAQTVEAPGSFRYTFSVWVRSMSAANVGLRLQNATGLIAVTRPVSSEWQRIAVTGELQGGEEIAVALEVPRACAVEIFGPQLEPQSDASGYRHTTDSSGVCRARFDQDDMEQVTHGPEDHAVRFRVREVRT